MRVLTVTPIFPGAAFPTQGVFVLERHRRLPADVEVTVARFRPAFPGMGVLKGHLRSGVPKKETVGGLAVHDVRFFYFPGVLKGLDGDFFARALERFVREHGPFDLLDAHFLYPAGYAAVTVGRRMGIPVVVTERGTASSYRDPARRRKMKAALLGATRLVTVSASLAAVCREIAGQELSIRVIPNGVDDSVFCPGDRLEAKRTVGVADAGPCLLTVGGLVPRKGVARVLEVLPGLVRKHPDLRYVVVGSGGVEGDHERAIRAAIVAGGLEKRVLLVGAVDHRRLAEYYRAADLFVLSTSNEGWANVLQESLACGTPVVTTDVGGNREVVGSETNGFIVPFGDPKALEAAIARALETPFDRAAIAAFGGRRSWARVGEEVHQVFLEATRGG